jgi:glycosyltransferase involved in cell wall biosynthesis
MRIAIVHGYYLHDSGSGIYVRELARAFVRLGHDVTLICQEREPQLYDFVDSGYLLDEGNAALRQVHDAPRRYAGSCRLVRPDLGGELLVYVEGPFPGFDRGNVAAFQHAPAQARDRYIARNVAALRTVFAEWPPELVLAQHLVMQPHTVRAALAGTAPYIVTEHGSALNFSVRACDELVRFALDGLSGATAVATVSTGARDDLVGWSAEHGLDIADKTVALPPGIDADVFALAPSRVDALETLRALVPLPAGFEVGEHDDILAFAGSVRDTKGLQHAIAALPLVARSRGRNVRLLIAGDGPARPSLERLAAFVAAGDTASAVAFIAANADVRSPAEYGSVLPEEPAQPLPGGASVAFLGHLDHAQLAAVFAAADVAVVPSVFPEAAALVSIEALAAGALSLASYHSGMASLDEYLADAFGDAVFTSLAPGPAFTERIASGIVHVLDTWPTADPSFRAYVRALALERYPTWDSTAEAYLALV